MLRPLYVVNPYADRLTFLDDTTRTRRDHLKYLGLIDAVALLHQHQRPVKTGVVRGRQVDYVEASLSDIAIANQLASEALGRTLDELPPQTRRLLFLLEQMVDAECEAKQLERCDIRFTRRQARQHTSWGNTQLRVHISRLVDMEYLIVHHGRRGQSFVYELLYDGEGRDGSRFVLGLLDAAGIEAQAPGLDCDSNLAGSDDKVAGSEEHLAGSKRGQNGPLAGGWRSDSSADTTEDDPESEANRPRNASRGARKAPPSYPQPGRSSVSVPLSAAPRAE
jgi:hypothetical protein